MTSIPSFGTSLLQNAQANQTTAPSVEEILQNTPQAPMPEQAPDSFNREGEMPQRKGFDWFSATATALGALGVFLAGRKGWLGKYVQTWFGGRMSLSKVHKNIEAKISEYLGRDGVGVNSAKIVKNAEGNKVLRAEFENGAVQEFAVTESKNVIKLSTKDMPLGVDGQVAGKAEEVILFNRLDGSPKSRVRFIKGENGKVQEYAAFKGEDILDEGFSESSGIYRSYQKSAPRRRYLFGLFGPKQVKTVSRTYTNPETGEASVTSMKTVYKHGKKAKIHQQINGQNRTIIFDNSGKISQIQTKGNDGKVIVQHFDYALNPEGKQVLSEIRYTDAKGNPITPPSV